GALATADGAAALGDAAAPLVQADATRPIAASQVSRLVRRPVTGVLLQAATGQPGPGRLLRPDAGHTCTTAPPVDKVGSCRHLRVSPGCSAAAASSRADPGVAGGG